MGIAARFFGFAGSVKRGRAHIHPGTDSLGRLFFELHELVNREDRIQREWQEYEKAEHMRGKDRDLAFVRAYFLFEDFLVKNKPIVVKREFSRENLRAYIRGRLDSVTLPATLRVIFTEGREQRLLAYENYLTLVFDYFLSALGEEKVKRFILQHGSDGRLDGVAVRDGRLSFDAFNARFLKIGEADTGGRMEEFFGVFMKAVYTELNTIIGAHISEGLFVRSYEAIKSHYEPVFAARALDIVPDGILEDEKISMLDRKSLEEQVREQTRELKSEKEAVDRKVEERTRELQIEKRKLDIVTENMKEGAILLDANSQVLFVSRRAKEILDLFSSIEGSRALIVAFEEKFRGVSVAENLEKCAPGASYVVPEFGSEGKFFKITFSRVEATSILYSLIWIEDITEAKLLEQKKSEFVSLVTHQLRTPLSGLKWTLRMLINGDLGELQNEQKVFVMKAYESNERMIGLVDDILGANKLGSSKTEYHFIGINLIDLFDSVLYEIRPAANRKRISIIFDERPADLPKVLVDSEKMRAVIQNLLENAVKYTPEAGSITIRIYEEKTMVTVSIRDTGIGIPKGDQSRIFGQFFRANNALSGGSGGSGLGLFIVKSIIEKHHGLIWFESVDGKGTTFHFSIPAMTGQHTVA